MAFVILSLLLLFSFTVDASRFKINVDTDDGGFDISISGTLWFSSGGVWARNKGKWYSSFDRSLTLANSTTRLGSNEDRGPFERTTFNWASKDGFKFTTYVETYTDTPFFVVFGQTWDEGGDDTSCEDRGSASLWPAFVAEDVYNTGYMTYSGNFAAFMKFGTFTPSSAVYDNIDGGFPLMVFDKQMKNAMVISPFDTFMSASLTTFTPSTSEKRIFGLGIVPEVNSVPKGYTMETIVVGGDNVTSTMAEWGQILRKKYKKDDKYRKADFSINYLGYWTDNGACYYYGTGEYKSYEDAILAVKKTSEENNIPYRYLQLDSWWYFKGDKGGVKNWTAMPGIFPDGMHYLSEKTGWDIVAHNRYWSNNNDYAKQNGGNYTFVVDKEGYSVPNDTNFWKFLLSSSKKEWNLMVYEQDWLDKEYQNVAQLQSILNFGETWLNQMGEAALDVGMNILYCMPWTRHILQSLANSAVTQIRVSDDYQPGNGQWQVGDTSILANAVGLASFKDTFRTITVESNCKFMNPEPYPALETYVAALTGGSIGPSDTAKSFNKTLIMSTCMADGLLLKPTHPAMSLDSTFVYRAFGSGGPDGEITVAYTEVSGFTWYFILSANLTKPYNMSVSELPPSSMVKPQSSFPVYIAMPTRLLKHGSQPPSSISLSHSTDVIPLSSCGKDDFQFWILAPVLPTINAALLGELDKIISISEQRFSAIEADKDVYNVMVKGAENELANYWTISSNGEVHQAQCGFKQNQRTLVIDKKGNIKC